MKKGNKHNAIEIGESLEEEEKMNKWKDFEVYHMIAIRKEMDLESTKTSNKQGIFKKYIFLYKFLFFMLAV